MKIESLFKSKKQKVVYIILFAVMLFIYIYLGTVNFDSDVTDAEKFAKEFPSVSTNNVYLYTTPKEILEYLEDDALVLFGSSTNDFTEDYAKMINDVAKECGITKIVYYDFLKDRSNNNGNYELLVEELKPYLLTDDAGKTEIYAPTFLVVKNKEVLYINGDVNFVKGDISPNEYWTDLKVGVFKETLKAVFKDFVGEEK